MDKTQIIVEDIGIYANKILELVEQLDINKRENVLDYKLEKLVQLPIKQCVRCNKYFLPKYGNESYQIYCGYECRNNSVIENQISRRINPEIRGMELLRKRIYELKYNARKVNKELKINDGLNEILKELKLLRKKYKCKEITNKAYENELNNLYKQYYMWLKLNK